MPAPHHVEFGAVFFLYVTLKLIMSALFMLSRIVGFWLSIKIANCVCD